MRDKRGKGVFVAYWHDDYSKIEWEIDCHCSGAVRDKECFEPTHWMELPEPPKD